VILPLHKLDSNKLSLVSRFCTLQVNLYFIVEAYELVRGRTKLFEVIICVNVVLSIFGILWSDI